jgi:hypothetical protein
MLGNKIDMVEGFPAVDLSSGANTGDWVNVKNASRVAVVFVSGVGTAGDDPTLTIQQAKDNSGTGAKALNFATVFRKQAATNLSSTTSWTETTQSAANTYTNATAAEQSLIWWVEFAAEDLDVANGFDHIRATVADVGTNAQPGYLMYLVEPMYPNDPDNVITV